MISQTVIQMHDSFPTGSYKFCIFYQFSELTQTFACFKGIDNPIYQDTSE